MEVDYCFIIQVLRLSKIKVYNFDISIKYVVGEILMQMLWSLALISEKFLRKKLQELIRDFFT